MPCRLDFNINVIQIMDGHFYIYKFTPYVGAWLQMGPFGTWDQWLF